MNISKPIKILIGVLTIFAILFQFVIMPAFSMLFMFISGFPFFESHSISSPVDLLKTMLPLMMVFYPTMMCFSLVQLGLQVFYVIHEIKNKALTDTIRILCVIGTFFMPIIAMPIYYFAYLLRDNPQTLQPPQA